MVSTKLTPRRVAVQVLHRITEDGAYADIALDKAVNRHQFSALDRAFLTELVYGSVKLLCYLDYIISRFSSRPVEKLEPELRNLLRLGLYQIFLLDNIPDGIAVYETVEAAKGLVHRGSQNYLNGLLRTAVRSKAEVLKDSFWPSSPSEYLGTRLSHPQWLIERWISLWGLPATTLLCEANNQTPPLTLRTNTLKTSREDLLAELHELGIDAAPSALARDGIELHQGVSLSQLKPLLQGRCQVQDSGSQLISELLNPLPGERILDACSAPGGKTTHLAQLMQDNGEIIAADVNTNRLKTVQENCQRLGVTCVQTEAQDAALLFERTSWAGSFDKVLVDAPCTGTGVLRRRADSRWRKHPQDLVELPRLQKAIISGAAEMVKPGGVLVYSTCSVDPAENQGVMEWFLAHNPGWIAEDFRSLIRLPADLGLYLGQATLPTSLFLYPHREKTDGFFAARVRKSN